MKKNEHTPPVLGDRLLRLMLSSEDYYQLSGDIEEVFRRKKAEKGFASSIFWYWLHLFKSLPTFLSITVYWSFVMFKNYLKIAFRNLFKIRVFSIINIFGLAVGMAACLLIIQYITKEFSYDRFHEHADNIYRLRLTGFVGDKIDDEGADCNNPAGKVVTETYPEVVDFAKMIKSPGVFSIGDLKYREEKVFYASSSFFKVFSFKLLKGDLETVLSEPNKMVISETTAKKYFRDEDPVGKTLSVNGRTDFMITGVFEDVPGNSHFKFDILKSFETVEARMRTSWAFTEIYTYLQLRPDADPKALEAKFPALAAKENEEIVKKYGFKIKLFLQPLTDIHLKSHLDREIEQNGSERFVYFLVIISLFILVIAWINYINLSTARSVNRATEVGVRKVLGAYKTQLINQFLLESFLLNIIAAAAAIILANIFLPLLNNYTGLDLSFTLWTSWKFWLAFSVIFFTGTLLSGLYPSFILSSFLPVSVLKGKSTGSFKQGFLRRGLVVIQFGISAALIIGTFVVFRQVDFMQKKDLGINIDQTLMLKGATVITATSRQQYFESIKSFKNELLSNPSIKKVAASSFVPGEVVYWIDGYKKLEDTNEKTRTCNNMRIDYDYIDLYDIPILAGRSFSEEFPSDAQSVIINRAAMEFIGFENPEKALDKTIVFNNTQNFKIIGVIENYNHENLKNAYKPVVMNLSPALTGRCSIKLQTDDIQMTIAFIKDKWNKSFPGNPFDYTFLDETFNRLYTADRQFGKMFGIFAVLAILIACLGLFGLSFFTTVQRTKEIGIRKVLGASDANIIKLLIQEFFILTVIGNIIAWPAAGYIMHRWLQSFAFRVDLGWIAFVLAIFLTLVISIFTVSFQSIKAARINPADSIRYE